jgi:hypothetical protein
MGMSYRPPFYSSRLWGIMSYRKNEEKDLLENFINAQKNRKANTIKKLTVFYCFLTQYI